MNDLADFLLARIADDEAAAEAAIDPDRPGTHWHWVMDANDTPVAHGHLQRAQDDGESVSLRTVEEYPTRNGWSLPHFVVQSGEVHGTGGEHIARWDPARVLAECEAKRRIVDVYLDERSRRDVYQRDDARAVEDEEQARRRRSSAARCRGLEFAVESLALPYADRPDYREEWRP
jgi:hypothetical protein